MELLKSKKDVQRLLGTLNYIRKFIPNYSGLVSPLERYAAGESFKWTADLEESYFQIFNALSNAITCMKWNQREN